MDTIKSRANQHVQHARRVREGNIAGEFFVEGKRLIDELLSSQVEIESFFLTSSFAEQNQALIDQLQRSCRRILFLTAPVFASIAETRSPQGIAATCRVPNDGKARLEKLVAKNKRSIIVVLHRIANPGNLGAVLRSAEAFGASGVVVTEQSAGPYSPVSVRGSMGSVFRLPVWTGADLETVIEWGESFGMTSVCAEIEANVNISETDWARNLLVVFGSEGHGLTGEDLALVDEQFRIPMAQGVESLNLSVAAGIVLFEASRDQNS